MSLAATQLRLYIDSNRTLFEDKQGVWSKLARRKARRDYHPELGQRAFRRVVDSGARAYVSELGLTEKWSSAFSTDDRNQTAKTYEREFRERYSRGDLDALLPTKMRPKRRNVVGNPVRRGYDRATIRYNIETQRAEGKSMAQAIAIALRTGRDSFHAEHPGKPLPAFLREVPKPKKKTATKKRAKKKTTKKRAKKKTSAEAVQREIARRDRAYSKLSTAQKERRLKAGGPSLADELKRHGYTHKKARGLTNQYAQHICAPDGSIVFTGTAGEVWAWLHLQERATKKKAPKKRAKKKTTKKRAKKKTTKKRAKKRTTKKRATKKRARR